jgi:hypothetical protein
MHAEITNTPISGASLNLFRICTLHTPAKINKKSLFYLLQFLNLESNGSIKPNNPQSWKKTIEDTYKLNNISINQNITAVRNARKIYVITDSLNNRIIEFKRNKSASPLKRIITTLEKEDCTELFNPFLKLQGFSFISYSFLQSSI